MSDTADSARAARPDLAVSAWEDPPRVDSIDAAPILAVDGFAGPLDWWLEMARSRKIDLAKLSIATLIGTFTTAMDIALTRRVDGDLARWAVWAVMAATLTELWSRLLLPPSAPAARGAVAEAEGLRRQLLDRERMRLAANWLGQRTQLGRDVFRRDQPEMAAAGRRGELTELLRACLPVLQVTDDQAIAARPRPPPLWTASDAIAHLSRLLGVLPDGSPLTAFLPTIARDAPARTLRCRVAVASTLIASLERARDGTVVLDQDADWMPIRVVRRANGDPGAGDAAPPA